MDLRERLDKIRADIAEAAVAAGREPTEIKLVAVSKTYPSETVVRAIVENQFVFGENKVQEGVRKIKDIGDKRTEWHLIGHLQKNKVRKAVNAFDVIQTVDSIELAVRLERICEEEEIETQRVLIQVDLAGETGKFGIPEKGVLELAEYLAKSRVLEFEGLMTLPPFFEDAEKTRPYFQRLAKLRDELRNEGMFGVEKGELSMGMSNDFRVAIEEGATIVRIGTAIFGERSYNTAS